MRQTEFTPYTLTQIENGEVSRPIRIFAEGVYDLFHVGHIESLKQAKKAFPNVQLVVGVCSDEDVLKYKGGRTVMSYAERAQAVRLCKYVDEVVENHPFYFPVEYLDMMRIDLIAHDALPYNLNLTEINGETDDFYSIFKKADRFLTTQRAEGISTTDLIQRILDNVDVFQKRNVVRA